MLNIESFKNIIKNTLPFLKTNGKGVDVCMFSKIELARNFEIKSNIVNTMITVEEFFSDNYDDVTKLEIRDTKLVTQYLKALKIINSDDTYSKTNNTPIEIYLKKEQTKETSDNPEKNTDKNTDNQDTNCESLLLTFFDDESLKITSYHKGYDFVNIFDKILGVERDLQEVLDYQFSYKFGYLTKNLSTLGLGLSVQTYIYSPYFKTNKSDVIKLAGSLGLQLEYEEIDFDYYRLYLANLHRQNEKEVLTNFETVLEFIVKGERQKRLLKFNEDKYMYMQYLSESKARLKTSYLLSHGILRNIVFNYMFGNSIGIINEKELQLVIEYYIGFDDNYMKLFENDQIDFGFKSEINTHSDIMQKYDIFRAELLRKLT